MATVNKDFKIKQGLVVEGTTATVNGFDLLTKKQADQDYIVGLIGGTATSANEANKVVKRDANGDFAAGEITADLVGNVTGQVSSLSNHDTDDLAEGNNLYFTNQRALNATASAYDAAGSASAAQSAAASDATTKANAAQAAAEATAAGDATSKANAAQSAAQTAAASDATTKANAAEAAANGYTNGKISDEETARNTAISSAISTEASDRDSAIATAKTAAISDSKEYTDQEVAALVDGAPALLNTLNELAAAIADNPNYATDVANLVAGKADTTYVDDQDEYYDGLASGYASTAQSNAAADAATKANAAETAANAYTNDEITNALSTAQGYANTAESNANTYAEGLASSADSNAYGYANTAESNAASYTDNAINALDTDDIEEGSTNLYFTDSRAKISAGDLLAGANTQNVDITFVGGVLNITAENGVTDSTTDYLFEGSTNLYFTDARARTAVDGTDRAFTSVEINSVAKQVAATLEAATAGVQVAYAFDKEAFRSAEFLVKVAYGSHTEISKVLLTLDTSDNIAITEYGIVGTNGSASSISAGIVSGNVELQVTTASNNSTVTVMGTLLV